MVQERVKGYIREGEENEKRREGKGKGRKEREGTVHFRVIYRSHGDRR